MGLTISNLCKPPGNKVARNMAGQRNVGIWVPILSLSIRLILCQNNE